ncbi:YdiK family protein [Evansella sp. AB-rgal1]|uniref:YdiK family protein n=1 Tax=Evansella sp. AB-rgal1 TaxID=3242696 RepID=UPI00359E53A2
MKTARFTGYMYFLIATVFVFFAIQQHNRTGEWDFITLLLIGVAAIDYMIAFRYFSALGKGKDKK